MTDQALAEGIKDFPIQVRVKVWGEISEWRVGHKSSVEEIFPVSERLSMIVADPNAGLDILFLLVCTDPAPQIFLDKVQGLSKKWSSPIDGNMATLTDAITARDKITWNKDCWGDVNRLIESKNFEDAIEMARLYEEQDYMRSKIN